MYPHPGPRSRSFSADVDSFHDGGGGGGDIGGGGGSGSGVAAGSSSGAQRGSKANSLRSLAKKTLHFGLPGLRGSHDKSLFIFSEENIIRKYAKIIIEWGYPFTEAKVKA